MVIILADTLSSVTDRWAHDTPTKIQTLPNKIFVKWGGNTPHVGQIAHAWGGGAVYLYIYSYIKMYK